MRTGAITLTVLFLALAPAAGEVRPCTVSVVLSGDTFLCDDGTRIRLWGISAPRPDEPHGPGAWHALRSLVGGQTVECEPRGKISDGIKAFCRLDGSDVAARMVEDSWARDCPSESAGFYSSLEDERHGQLVVRDACRTTEDP
jgi:endonuclease YncB( thermonuclease family)